MELKNKLFAILAVFCVMCSACAVCAADNVDYSADYVDASHEGQDVAIIPPDSTHDEAKHAAGGDQYLDGSEDGHNGTIIPPDAGHNEQAMMNSTGNNTASHAAGENVGNATNSTLSNVMHATGNPIMLLLAVVALIGGLAVFKRKN